MGLDAVVAASLDACYVLECVRHLDGQIADFTVVFANELALEQLGVRSAVGQPVRELVSDADSLAFVKAFEATEPYDHDFQGASDPPRWYRQRAVRMNEFLIVSSRDISKQKELEESLRSAQDLYMALFESTTDPRLLVDMGAYTIFDANTAATLTYGYAKGELVGLPLVALAVDTELAERTLRDRIGFARFRPHRKKDGTTFPVELSLSYFDYRWRSLCAITVSDLSDRIREDAVLQQSRRQYRLLAENSADLIALSDLTGTVRYASPSHGLVLGYTPAEVMGTDLFARTPSEDAASVCALLLLPLLQGSDRARCEHRQRSKDGALHWFETVARPVHDDHGNLVGIQTAARDVSERRDAEVSLRRHAERLAFLHEVGLSISEAVLPEAIADITLAHLGRMLPFVRAGVFLFDPVCGQLRSLAISGTGPETLPWQGAMNVEGDQVVVRSPDEVSSPLREVALALWDDSVGALLVTPLRVRGQFTGQLMVCASDPDTFDSEARLFLAQTAAPLAIAIEQASLFEQVRDDARAKALLLDEANHRVHNNLAALIGLLYIDLAHVRGEESPALRAFMDRIVQRIMGLSAVHRLLSANGWSAVRLTDLAHKIFKVCTGSLTGAKTLCLKVDMSPVTIAPSQAINLALVITELVANTMQHGMADSETCDVEFHVERAGGIVRVTYRDSGPGFSDEVLGGAGRGAGMQILHEMVCSGLRGVVELASDHGAVTVLQFSQNSADPIGLG